MNSYSLLDLAPITEGSNASEALANTLDLAQHAERCGYHRYWLAEHHNMTGIASAATAVVIGHVAGGTKTIKVGAGGVMLPNHAPLIIAEQFGTLDALYPGRIELGLGRAPGTDQRTARALRRDLMSNAEHFPQDLEELQGYLGSNPGYVKAVPGTGSNVPIWILGSSLFSAQLAAREGLPYAFASHFAPQLVGQALNIYRSYFQPSKVLEEPYAMIGVNLFAAETDAEAELLFSSVLQQFMALRFGTPGPMPAPRKDLEKHFPAAHLQAARQALLVSAVGSAETVEKRLRDILDVTDADELILTGQIFDHSARKRSFEIGAKILQGISMSKERLPGKLLHTQ